MPAQAKIGSPFTRNQVRIFDPGVPSASANSVSGMRQRLAGLPAINFHMKLERSAILFTAFGLIVRPVILIFCGHGKPQTILSRVRRPSASGTTLPDKPARTSTPKGRRDGKAGEKR